MSDDGEEAKNYVDWLLGRITYIIIKQIEINICCKLACQRLQLAFDIPCLSEDFVVCLL